MIVDQTENVGEHAWTKLLDDKDSAVIVKMSSQDKALLEDLQKKDTQKETAALTIDHLSSNCASGICVGAGSAIVGETGVQISRKESFLGTFHRQLRRSFKAVSESPGPITR